jgi:hypothetical protein
VSSKQDIIDKIDSFYRRIHEHEDKIRREENSHRPNYPRIDHWRKEISTFYAQVERLQQRLNEGGYTAYCFTCGREMRVRNNACVRCRSYLG